jgi:hypothetical protein
LKLKIEIVMDNAAFDPNEGGNGAEAARILRALATKIEGDTLAPRDVRPLIDFNGNRVGEAKVTR